MKVSGSAPKIEVTQLQMEELASTTSQKKKKKAYRKFYKEWQSRAKNTEDTGYNSFNRHIKMKPYCKKVKSYNKRILNHSRSKKLKNVTHSFLCY